MCIRDRNSGMTIILSSHYLDEIDKLADKLVIIDDGRVIAQGAPAELKIKLDVKCFLIK